jgi:tetratricopeptide (TPR) repeat protein
MRGGRCDVHTQVKRAGQGSSGGGRVDRAQEAAAADGTRPVTIHDAAGVLIGDGVQNNYFGADLPAHSMYLELVRQIAPHQQNLAGREAELAELTRFCTAPGGSRYAWWQAPAWAGKSALLSTFVLGARGLDEAGVKVVSFFITARLPGQDSRDAFTQVLGEQLAELAGQPWPAGLPEPLRELKLHGLMSLAASACRDRGGRLVLVVDGLDEDRGATAGGHSIAALLPGDPPHDMRVIVAGRANPPLPDDVREAHPLRDPAIVRPLAPSPFALDAEHLGQWELQRLLDGSRAGRDVLGLLTAARGGLSGQDLARLVRKKDKKSGIGLWEAEKILRSVAGRTFDRRPARWDPDTPEVYVIAHGELQVTAERYLDSDLPGYRQRLDEWAQEYRRQGWPAGTPVYLLDGYPALLASSGDLTRMAANALDPARHARLLAVTGADGAALAEIGTALELTVAGDDPDLGGALALACCRDHLTARNTYIPDELPLTWAVLRQPDRAEAVAAATGNPGNLAALLADTALALAEAGQHEQAATTAEQALTAARLINRPRRRASVLADAARALAQAGQQERAGTTAEQALTAARTLAEPVEQASALAGVAQALAQAGQPDRAAAVAEQALTTARQEVDPGPRAWALAGAAQALALTGQPEKAQAAAEAAAAASHSAEFSPHGLTAVAQVLAQAGFSESAMVMADSVGSMDERAAALADVAKALARAGRHEQARAAAEQALATARSVESQEQRQTLDDVAKVLSQAGLLEPAVALEMISPGEQARALADIALALARAGNHEQAQAAAEQALASARSFIDEVHVLTVAALALALSGQHEQSRATAEEAESAARAITSSPSPRSEALARAARALARAGHSDLARTAAEAAKVEASSLASEFARTNALYVVARTLVPAPWSPRRWNEDPPETWSIPGSKTKLGVLADEAAAAARAGQRERAQAAAEQADAAARADRSGEREHDLAIAAEAWAHAGQTEQALTLARSITDPDKRARTGATIAVALARAGDGERSLALARAMTDPVWQARALASVALTLARSGLHAQAHAAAADAEAAARSVTALPTEAEAGRHVNAGAVLAETAETLGEAGATHSARRLAALLCSVAPWDYAAGTVLLLDPSAYPPLSRALDAVTRLDAEPDRRDPSA